MLLDLRSQWSCIDGSGLRFWGFIVGWMVDSWRGCTLYAVRSNFAQQFFDISRHRYRHMTLDAVDGYIHTQVFRPFPIDFNCVQFSKGVNEVVDASFVLPNDRKVVHHQSEANTLVVVAKK